MVGTVCKLMGAGLVLFFSWVCRRRLSARTDPAGEQIDGYLSLFGVIRRRITYERVSMAEIMAGCDSLLLRACMGEEKGDIPRDLSSLVGRTVFRSEALAAVVTEAAERLGRGYHDEQVAACDRYFSAIETVAKTHRQERQKSGTVRDTLIGTAAAAIVLLLW